MPVRCVLTDATTAQTVDAGGEQGQLQLSDLVRSVTRSRTRRITLVVTNGVGCGIGDNGQQVGARLWRQTGCDALAESALGDDGITWPEGRQYQ